MSSSTLDRPTKRRCKAHSSRTGEPCKLPPLKGQDVCRSHGGAAKQCRQAAQRRLDEAADRMAKELLGIAYGAESEAVKLAAVKDALDRAGLSPKHAVELEVSTAPWQEVLSGVARITQDESRRARGLPVEPDPTPALPAADNAEPIDAEVVEQDGPPAQPPWAGDEPPQRPGTSLMTLEQAAEDMARDRARTGTRRIRNRRARY
jgi:hypothetical protein